ncbi:MAG: extracellular solute-binding protein, partial [Defluviitaleaceae bacterium]|nr:extracellular solute-binding protein [Defluviitaleaceae bacterium]
MKRITKITICMGLVGILIFLAACGNSNGNGNNNGNNQTNQNAATGSTPRATATGGGAGRFVETDITPPIGGWFMTLVTPDGALAAFDEGLRIRYDSADGGATWTHTSGPGAGSNQFESVRTATFLPDGNLLAYVQGSGMTVIAPDGTTTHLPIATIDSNIAGGDSHNIALIQALDDGQLLLSYSIDWVARMMAEGGLQMFGGEDDDIGAFDDMDTAGHIDLEDFDLNDMDIASLLESLGLDLNDLDLDALGDMDMDALMALRGNILEGFDDASNGDTPIGRGFGGQRVQSGGTVVRETVTSGTASSSVRVGGNAGGGFNFGGFDQTVATYDINTGAQTATLSHLEAQQLLGANSHGDVFTMQGHSILRYAANGDVDTVLDGTAFAFGAADNTVSSIHNVGDAFVVNVNAFTGAFDPASRLFKYTWDENAAVDPNKTLSIWSLHDNALVRAAITEIWRQNPDADITYEIALAGDTAMSAADAVRTLNTRLLSGSGPDILILDGAPIDSYAGRGMLLDLTGRVNTADMYQSLLAPYIHDGQMYVIPTQFSIPVLMGSPSDLAGLTTLSALVESILNGNPPTDWMSAVMLGGIPEGERAQVGFNDAEELFDIMWQANAPAFISDNRLDSGVLREFLDAILSISHMYGLATEQDDAMQGGLMMVSGSSGGGGRMNVLPGSLMQYMTHSTNIAAFSVNNLMFLQSAIMRDGSDFTMFPGLASGPWLPSTMVGVSADTSVEDFAMEFVNTMLSLDVQAINHGEGLPVTHTAMQAQIDLLNEMLAVTEFTFDIDMDGLIAQLQTPSIIENTL